jgi:hypothetical protein
VPLLLFSIDLVDFAPFVEMDDQDPSFDSRDSPGIVASVAVLC